MSVPRPGLAWHLQSAAQLIVGSVIFVVLLPYILARVYILKRQRRMAIMQNGKDVTKEVLERVALLAEAERRRTGKFGTAVTYLRSARFSLNELPRPWMNDCIHDSIVAIDQIIENLQK